MKDVVRETADRILSSTRVTVLSGAGISKESGIPTFRDAQEGLWAKYDPMELATREGFRKDPKLVWDWYEYRRELIRKAEPNPGHVALVRLERLVPEFTLITQNVDGLHARAGSGKVLELHGNINRNKCFDEDTVLEQWDDTTLPPTCSCGSYIRPDVVWFGESLSPDVIDTAFHMSRVSEMMLVVGTSGLVQPAASLPFHALDGGAWIVEINPEPTPLSEHVHVRIPGPSGIVLESIADLTETLAAGRRLP